MERTLILLLAAATIAGCSTAKIAKGAAPWPECARTQALSWLETENSPNWPTAAALPEDVEVQVVSLGAFPPEAIHDALFRTLHLVPSSNSMYVEQTGGIGGFHQLFGPISLSGYCASAP